MVTATITPVEAEAAETVEPAAELDAADEDTENAPLEPEALASTISDEEESTATEAVSEADESTVSEAGAESTEDEEGAEDAEDDLYQGQIQLKIASPVALDGVMRIHRELKINPQIEVKSFAVSAEDGVTVEVNLPAAMPFERFLQSLPGVTNVVGTSEPNAKGRGRRKGAASSMTVFRLSLS